MKAHVVQANHTYNIATDNPLTAAVRAATRWLNRRSGENCLVRTFPYDAAARIKAYVITFPARAPRIEQTVTVQVPYPQGRGR